ncbi:threonine ammonia-lyase IlvA [Chitinophaga sancti]|uniref:L-threonine dehydratase n=1 Tax=Chitinophaga sancti TaxID=1004 RepID=A0A1K1PUN1_9BACT|nr:threonine ammonia-lyase IlvA [Chitinophaga sancti]WQD61622.1 threonine ammonia-lyase IlvA [Chitinophaga sancti]WQG92821.1 threonine ammonia-lyase IlvA [Chitinophaga sancti]SFW51212.1 L-threonine ammonia-lyase [Chitinophaga sancti]
MSQVLTSVNPLNILDAAVKLKPVVNRTPLTYSQTLSRRYNADIYLKREDMQIVRSYKLRGAYNKISSLDKELLGKGVTCASAGNHAQGVAYACRQLDIKGVIFMPIITPKQKVNQVNMFGGDNIEIRLVGDTFDDCATEAQAYTKAHGMTFVAPFDDPKIIEGQGTVAVEVLEDLSQVDYIFVPIGGGGLAAGTGTYFKTYSPHTKVIGVEPSGAASMTAALKKGEPVTLDEIERFVDGAAVKRVGALNFEICKDVLDKMHTVAEGKVCTTILKLYNEDAIVVEPAGALSIAALDDFAKEIEGKKVVCVVSGGNNDIDRMQEIKERSLLFEGLKHYFIIRFVQRPGALKEFVNHVLGPDDDITRFEFIQKHNKETGPALIGVELKRKEDYDILVANFKKYGIHYTALNEDDNLFGYLV